MIGLLMILPLQIVSGQDKIITLQRDTILCRIVSISSTHIQYEQKVDGYSVGKFIPTEQVLTYFRISPLAQFDPYDWTSRQKTKPSMPVNRWMIGVYPGGSTLLASTADDEKMMIAMGIPKSQAVDYCKKLNRGWSIGGDFHYMSTDNFGFGAKYSLFASTVQKDLTIAINSILPEFLCVGMDERMYIYYAGPSALFRQWLDGNRKFQLTETLSAGYVHYRDETRIDPNQYSFIYYPNIYGTPVAIYNILTVGNTWGANAAISADYFPLSWLSVGVNAGLMYARLTKVDISTKETTQTVELDKKDEQSLSRFDYSLCIRFHLK